MAVLRSNNWLGQQRVDVPHLRAVESSLCADFDVLAGNIIAGFQPVIVSGFDAITTGAVGQPATNLQINVANAVVMHTKATDSGTFLQVPSTRAAETLNSTNTRVKGGFTSSSTNYIGIDLVRSADSTTADLVQFLNPVTNIESPKDVPLGRTFDYVIYVSTQDFSATPNICPLAIVTTDSSNNVSAITDARNMMFRLGSGGSNPNALYTYSWPGGRTELGTNADFSAADKKIGSQKDWMNAIMTRLWEVGGGEHWYSNTGWQNVQLVRNGTSVFVSTGDYFEWVSSNLHWKSLRVVFSNSTGWFNDIADQTSDSTGLTDLADGQCIYVDLDRTTNRTGGTALVAVKGTTATLGTPLIPGSRMIIAWRIGSNIFTRGNSYYVGATFSVATTSSVGTVKLHQASLTPATPVALTDGDLNTASGVPQFDINRVLTIGVPTGGTNQTALLATGLGTGTGIQGTGGASNGKGIFGQGGGTTGTGVQGFGASNAGVGSGIGGNFQGGTNTGTSSESGTSAAGIVAQGPSSGYGPAIVTKQSATGNIAAQQRAQRSDGAPMATTDYLGFRSGWIFEHQFFNDIPTIAGGTSGNAAGWSAGTTTNARVGWSSPIGGGNLAGVWPGGAIYLVFTNPRTNTDTAYLQGPSYYNMTNNATFDPSGYFNQQVWSFEFVMAFEDTLSGADYWIGWSSATAPTLPTASVSTVCAGIKFKQSAGGTFGGDTQLQLLTGDSTTQSQISLNITPALDARYRIRLELHRSGSPYGACVRCFVNGALTTKTTNLPITSTLGGDMPFQFIAVSTVGASTTPRLQMGPIRVNGFLASSGPLTAGPTTSDV